MLEKRACALLMMLIVLGGTAFAEAEKRVPISNFASGQTFYLEQDSYKPLGNGKLQYTVVSESPGSGGSQIPPRVSHNEVDCNTGQVKYPTASWEQGANGAAAQYQPGPARPFTLTDKTPLYKMMKDACETYAPDAPARW